MSSWRLLCVLSLAASLSLPHAAFSQDRNPDPDPAAETPAAVAIPEGLVEQVLAGDAEAVIKIREYLIGKERRPEDVTRRATALIAEIGRRKTDVGAETLLRIVDRVASSAINMVAGSQIIRMGVDSGFVPRRAVVAWDFGPPDGNVSPGFERVQPGDSRIAGGKVDGLRRPAESDLLNDGVAGVERIEADVPDGEYRIILMTQNLGDQRLMGNPFGSELVINGSALAVTQPSPDNWVDNALLSNRGVQAIQAQASPDAGVGGPGGFISGNLDNVDPQLFERQQGGAIIVPATARDGKLIIEMRGFQGARSYLTGLMIEPAGETSDMVLSNEAAASLVPPELRLAMEENILAAAATVLAEIDPAAGDPELVELPEPILDPEENASISS